MKLTPVPDIGQNRELVDLGPADVVANYEDGYIHMHVHQHLGGRGSSSIYLKLRPDEARKVADMLRRMALQHDEGAA
jgi:hypothetical protein